MSQSTHHYKKRPIYSLIFFLFLGFALAVFLWVYVGRYVLSMARQSDVTISSSTQKVEVNTKSKGQATLTLKSSKPLSAFHIIFKKSNAFSLFFNQAQVGGKSAPYIQILQSSSTDASYGILSKDSQTPKEIQLPVDVVCLSSGTHDLGIDPSSSFLGSGGENLAANADFSVSIVCPLRIRTASNDAVSPNLALTFDPVNQTVEKGKDMAMDVVLTPEASQAGIGAFDLNFHFDPNIFASVEVGDVKFLSGNTSIETTDI
ncbi:MAG: hypothetical protein ACMG6E_10040, partial [Candidatus Roizmanbacteria bacterium]